MLLAFRTLPVPLQKHHGILMLQTFTIQQSLNNVL